MPSSLARQIESLTRLRTSPPARSKRPERPERPARDYAEDCCMLRKALRERAAGLTRGQLAATTGIPEDRCARLLADLRAAGHVEPTGGRPMVWAIAGRAQQKPAERQLVTPSPARVATVKAPIFSPAITRVIRRAQPDAEHCVAADDLSAGAFMDDWRKRTSGGSDASSR